VILANALGQAGVGQFQALKLGSIRNHLRELALEKQLQAEGEIRTRRKTQQALYV
jgi:hypothetical protein